MSFFSPLPSQKSIKHSFYVPSPRLQNTFSTHSMPRRETTSKKASRCIRGLSASPSALISKSHAISYYVRTAGHRSHRDYRHDVFPPANETALILYVFSNQKVPQGIFDVSGLRPRVAVTLHVISKIKMRSRRS
jgi:hypothetical protein